MVNINNKNYDTHVINTNNPHTVTKTQVGLGNVLNIDTSVTTNITDTSSKRFVSDAEKTNWDTKKDMLPEIVVRTTISEEWNSVTYGKGMFVAVAASGTNRVMYSTDGVAWTAVAVDLAAWRSVAYGNGMFVALASYGTNRVMYSTDGVAWTAVAVVFASWRSVAYGNGVFVAVGTNRAMYSTDGVAWTPVAVSTGSWNSVTYGNGMFVAVAAYGTNRVMYSTDGVAWTAVAVEDNQWNSVTYGKGMFVAVAASGTNRVMYSTDGVAWTANTLVANEWCGITYGNGVFVAISPTGENRLMYSSDAVNWYYKNLPLMLWNTIVYGDGMFVALATKSSSGLLTIGSRTYSDKCRVIKKSVIGEIPVTILPADWTGTGPFEDTIPAVIAGEQITNTTHDIKIIPVWSGTIAQKKAAMEAYSYISEGVITSNNTFTLTCYDYKPEAELTLNLEVWRKWQ